MELLKAKSIVCLSSVLCSVTVACLQAEAVHSDHGEKPETGTLRILAHDKINHT